MDNDDDDDDDDDDVDDDDDGLPEYLPSGQLDHFRLFVSFEPVGG